MESRKEKNYDMYFDIWKNAKYPDHIGKALAMLRKYCRYGNHTSASFFDNCAAVILNVTKTHAEKISGIIKEYDSIPADSITRSIEYLLYRLYTGLNLNNITITTNGDLHTILIIIQEQTNILATSHWSNCYLSQYSCFVSGNITHCKSWAEAFREGKLFLKNHEKITNEVWDNMKDDKNLIQFLAAEKKIYSSYLLVDKFDNNDTVRTLYIEALKHKNYSIAHRAFCKLHSIRVDYESLNTAKSFESSVEMMMHSRENIISSDLLIEYFNHFPDDEKANVLKFFLNLYFLKGLGSITNWAQIENTICSDLSFSKHFKDCFISSAKRKSLAGITRVDFILKRNLVDINDKSMIVSMQQIYSALTNNMTLTHESAFEAIEMQLRMIKLLFDYSHLGMIALNKFVTIDMLEKALVIEKRHHEEQQKRLLYLAPELFSPSQKLVSSQLLEIMRDVQKKYRQSFTFFLAGKDKSSPVSELVEDAVSHVVKFNFL